MKTTAAPTGASSDRAVGASATVAGRRRWRTGYAWINVGLDAEFASLAGAAATLVAERTSGAESAGPPATSVITLVAMWSIVQAAGGTYDQNQIGRGHEEYRTVINGGVRAFALLGAAAFLGLVDLPREVLILAVPLATVAAIVHRQFSRAWIARQDPAGPYADGVIVVGSIENITKLIRHFRRTKRSGYSVVGAVVVDSVANVDVDGSPVPVLGKPADLAEVLVRTKADTVAVTDTHVLPGGLQRLAWNLEGSGIDLLVVPAIADVAGPRIGVRPAAGLPLLHVEEPEFGGGQRLMKEAFDRCVSVAALLALSPLLLLLLCAVRLHSPGPAFFRQTRVGRHGKPFTMWKFRTMRVGADAEQHALRDLNTAGGVMFKIADDPRRTTIGKWLRRYSIDELPQLVNVALGQMSLVGPRPPVPSEVADYADDVHRRLLVKPGMTGLWQVSGRSDLSWDETVRLDLYYIENWSIALDLTVLGRTLAAVLKGRGAY